MKKRMISVLLTLALLFSQGVPVVAADQYEGIRPGAWYETAARYAVDRGVMTGTGRGFEPDGAVTRATVVQLLYNLAGKPAAGEDADFFADVEGTWYQDAVCWALMDDVLDASFYNGVLYDGLFHGEAVVTRAETAQLLANYARANQLGKRTSETAAWNALDYYLIPNGYLGGVEFCYDNKVMVGDQKGYLRPNDPLNRAQLAQVIQNFGKLTAPDPSALRVSVLTNAYGSEMWTKVCNAFTAQTGVRVELICDRNLEDVIGPAMQGGDYPDVVHLDTGRREGLTETLIKERGLADMTDVLSMTVPGESKTVSEKLLPGFTETSLTNPYGDGRTYLAPMFYSPCGLFYNAALFEKKGWAVPRTWSEMWALGDKAKAEGRALFTYPTTGYLDMLWYTLLYEAGGPALFDRATHYEKGVWDTTEAKACFEVLTKLASYTHPATPAQANDMDFQQNQQLVLDNEALFMPNGSWITGEMADRPRADGFQWGMTALPAFPGGERYSYTWMEQCWIPAAAERKDAAKQFVAFLYSDVACELFAHSKNEDDQKANAIQPVKGLAERLTGDSKLFYSVYESGAKPAAGYFAPTKAAAGVSTMREAWLDPMNSLVSGVIKSQTWLEQIKRTSDRMRKNLLD